MDRALMRHQPLRVGRMRSAGRGRRRMDQRCAAEEMAVEIGAVGWARRFPIRGGVRAGRAWAADHLAALGWDETAPEVADAVVLAVSELLTNAHVHAHSDAGLVLAWDG